MLRSIALGMMIVGAAVPALAAETTDRTAKHQLQRQLQIDPDDPVVLARLARLYMVGGNAEKAAGLYRGMLSLDDVLLERQGGAAISSHRLAKQAIISLNTSRKVQLGSR